MPSLVAVPEPEAGPPPKTSAQVGVRAGSLPQQCRSEGLGCTHCRWAAAGGNLRAAQGSALNRGGLPPLRTLQVLLEALVGHLKHANDGRRWAQLQLMLGRLAAQAHCTAALRGRAGSEQHCGTDGHCLIFAPPPSLRLADALEPRLAACPAKVQLPGVGAAGGEAGMCAGGQAAASVQAAGASPTVDRSACSSASQALQEAADLTTAITAYSARGQGLAACGASAGTDSHFGGGAAGPPQPAAPQGPSPAPAVAPAHEPATPAWDEAQVQLLVEHYPIKLSFLRGLVL